MMQRGDENAIVTAREFLQKIIKMDSSDAVAWYNLACCESLLGRDLEKSVSLLSRSISAGFRDVTHIVNDDDLVNIRELKSYNKLIDGLKKGIIPPQVVEEEKEGEEKHQEKSGDESCQGRMRRRCGQHQQHQQQHQHPNWFEHRAALFLHRYALRLMSRGDADALIAAKESLKKSIAVQSRWNHGDNDKNEDDQSSSLQNRRSLAVTYYNLSCCESLIGDDLDSAVENLREATRLGYANVEHMKRDTDLDNIRSLSSFKEIIYQLEKPESNDESDSESDNDNDKEEATKVEEKPQEKKKEEEKEKPLEIKIEDANIDDDDKEEEEKNEKKNEEEEKQDNEIKYEGPFAKTLREIEEMGFADRSKIIRALVSSRGNKVSAIERLLANN